MVVEEQAAPTVAAAPPPRRVIKPRASTDVPQIKTIPQARAEEPTEKRQRVEPAKPRPTTPKRPTRSASLSKQAAFNYAAEQAAAADANKQPGRRTPLRRTATGPQQVPRLHPGLELAEESEWEIPTFIRHQQNTSSKR